MLLTKEEASLFFPIWMPLLAFVNSKYKVIGNIKNIRKPKDLKPMDVKQLSDKLFEDISIIDEYFMQNKSLPEIHKSVIKSWKTSNKGHLL